VEKRVLDGEPRVRIAHLSDLHLDGSGLESAVLTRQALSREEATAADAIIVCGDVTDRGWDSQLDLARESLRQVATRQPLIVVPGNHDVSQWHGLGGRHDEAGEVDELFTGITRASAETTPLDSGRSWPIRMDLKDGACVVYGIDSTRAHPNIRAMARGRLGERQLAALDEDLASLGPRQRRVLVLHHHVLRLPLGRQFLDMFAGEWAMAIEDRKALRDIIRRHHVDLVLHGHRHHFLRKKLGTTRIISASSTTKGCGLTGQRFFGRITLGLDSGAVEVERVQYARPAPHNALKWLFDMESVYDNTEAMEAWVNLAEKAYNSEETFITFAEKFQETADRIGAWNEVSRHLDRHLAELLQRAEQGGARGSTAPSRERALADLPEVSPIVFALLQQGLRSRLEGPAEGNEGQEEDIPE